MRAPETVGEGCYTELQLSGKSAAKELILALDSTN